MMNFHNSSHSNKVRRIMKWFRPLLVLGALGFSLWFFYAVYAERNDGQRTERIGNSADDSKRLRTEVRTWFRKTFPDSAARADARYGVFEFEASAAEGRNKWVILAHGLDEPGNIWGNLAPPLYDRGYRVLEFRYPNDQPIHESSVLFQEQLLEMLSAADSSGLPGEIHLIGHSMGGLVLRNFLTHPDFRGEASGTRPPIKSFIQVATPNHGSWLATYRLPAELRDHLYKDYGFDALLGMIWDGAGEAQIDLKPESEFLAALNGRPFPPSIYWVGIAGIGSPVDLNRFQTSSRIMNTKLSESAGNLNETFPELFKGTGDGCVSVESVRCEGMDAVYSVEATHRNIVRRDRGGMPPAIPIVLEVLDRF